MKRSHPILPTAPLRIRLAASAVLLATPFFGSDAPPEPASPAVEVDSDVDPVGPLAFLIGDWRGDFRVAGEGSSPPTMSIEWGPQKAYLRILGYRPAEEGGVVPEHETFLFWHPRKGEHEMRSVYFGSENRMLETGTVELLDDGGVRLHMDVHYAAGERLPFSDGEVAGPGGRTLSFRRTLHDDEGRLRGTFRMRRGDRWVPPRSSAPDSYLWDRTSGTASPEVPGWVRDHFERHVRGSGRWITSNAAYVSEQETDDHYAIEWRWAVGRQGVRGRLFGLRDGDETGTYWELHSYWDPAERRVVADQFGANGAVGTGTIHDRGDGVFEVVQTFTAPDGSRSRTRHLTTLGAASQTGTSYGWDQGEWKPRRTYTWNLEPAQD